LDADQFFNPALRQDLSQGDVLEFCPVGAVPSIRVARVFQNQDQAKPDKKAIIYDYPLPPGVKEPSPPLFRKDGGVESGILFDGRMKRCVVLSDDCVALAKAQNQALAFELTEKAKNTPWHVAPVEPWPTSGELASNGELMGDLIASGRVKRYLEVPRLVSAEGEEIVARGYVDMRFLTPVKPEVFKAVRRLASLSDRGVAVLWAKIFTYFSGKPIPPALACPTCGNSHSLKEYLDASNQPKAATGTNND